MKKNVIVLDIFKKGAEDWICFSSKDKVNAPVCDPVSVCGNFFIFSFIDEADDEKPYDNHYKHYPEGIRILLLYY